MSFLLNPFRFISGFDPLDLSPKLWLDATDVSTLTLSGTDVTTWGDKSGNGYDFSQATPANKPVVDNASTPTKITFTAANSEWLDGDTHVSNFTSDSVGETCIIFETNAIGVYTVSFTKGGNNSYFVGLANTTSTTTNRLIVNNGSNIINDYGNYNAGYDVTNHVINASDCQCYVNNSEQTATVENNTGTWISDLAVTPDRLRMGVLARSATSYYTFSIRELLYFDSPLSTAERTDLYDYLVAKHGIFTPLSLSPKLWLDATDLSSLTLSGTDVTTWGDKSGNGYDFSQATPANKPVVDNATTPTKITFTAANSEFLDGSSHISNFTSDTQGEVVMVLNYPTAANYQFSIYDAADSNRRVAFGITSLSQLATNFSNPVNVYRAGTVDTAVHILNYNSDGANYEIYKDNAIQSYISGTDNGNWFGDTGGTKDTISIAFLEYGPFYYDSDVYEILYFDAPLTTEERTDLYDYLVAKHGL